MKYIKELVCIKLYNNYINLHNIVGVLCATTQAPGTTPLSKAALEARAAQLEERGYLEPTIHP